VGVVDDLEWVVGVMLVLGRGNGRGLEDGAADVDVAVEQFS